MKEARYNFTLSGLIISMILVAMFGTVFALTLTEMNNQYGVAGENTFSKYANYTAKLNGTIQNIRNETDIQQNTGITDIIGGYFKAGYSALKTSAISLNMFQDIMSDTAEDVPEFSLFSGYIILIILAAIFILLISVLVKMRI